MMRIPQPGWGYDSVYSVNDSVSGELGIFIRNINCRGYVSTVSKNSNDISADATFCNTIFPFTIKWDASKLYTTLLDSTVYPNAGIDTPLIKIEVEAAGGNVIIATKPNLSSINGLIQESNLFKITPNPINDYFTIKTEQKDIEKMKIFNLQGQEVKQIEKYFDVIDVSNLNTSLYFLQINTQNQTFIYKILKN